MRIQPPEHESAVERAIREAGERGALDNLPGAGKPLHTDDAHDENWWIRQYAAREDVPGSAFLPMSLQLRKEAEALPRKVSAFSSEDAVRREVADLNARISGEIAMPTSPIPLAMRRLDPDAVVRSWREERDRQEAANRAAATAASTSAPAPGSAPARRRRWWWPSRRAPR